MRSCAAARHQLVAQPARQWKVDDPVTMQMSELAAAHAKLDAAEAMRSDIDLRPRRDGGSYPVRWTALFVTHLLAPIDLARR